MLLSVVIPFYQVEHYIGACLDALAGLPEENCEILLIDDCGRDASAAIAADYSAAHPNARVIRRAQNGGLSSARNTGLDAAQGEYVYFLDSDDVPRADALWHLTQAAKEKRLDVAKARFRFLDDDTGELTDGPMILPTDVLEGGALRTIFSSGVCDAFLNEKLPMPDYTIGVSAGIAYGVSYLSRQKRRNLQLLMHYANDRRYMGWGNFFDPRNRSYFGLKFAYDTIPNELVPFDYDTFEAYPGQVEAVVTNLQTGRAEYREVPRRDASFLLLQATCAMPVLFQPIRLDDGAPYLDGGCSDAIPWKRALAVGCDRVVVVLTRERSYRKEPEQLMPLFRRVYRKYPVFLEGLRTRAERYNQCREELFALEQEGRVLVIAPANTRGFSRTERDRQKILALWQDGFFAGRRAAEAVRDFWTRETPSAGTPE